MGRDGPPRELRDFVAGDERVEAVVQRCGRRTFDLVLVDRDGNWVRSVFESKQEAVAVAGLLDVPVHEGWDEDLARAMNRRDHWNVSEGRRRAR